MSPRTLPVCRWLLSAILVVVILATAAPAGAATPPKGVKTWWQYEPKLWHDGWNSHAKLDEAHDRWKSNHKHPSQKERNRFHREIERAHRRLHFHDSADKEAGQATWYDAEGSPGACGDGLHGIYLAHKTWPCGTLVSVRSHGSYLFATVQDRGPYGEGRVVDLSPKAFKMLAPLDVGVIDVHIVRLKD